MTSTTPPLSRKRSPPPLPDTVPPRSALAGPLGGLYEILLLVSGGLLVALIAQLDYCTGPQLSFNIFYLIPVAACAWWGGFSHGILLALAASLAWCLVDALENPLLPLVAELWNGITRFGTLSLTASLVSRLHTGMIRERCLARTDPLTGAANGRTFYEAAALEAERARRTGQPLTLAYLDLDDFKQLNDRLGHAAGDAALVHAVSTVRQQLRTSDLLARLGGDEFALLLPNTNADGAVALLRRMQAILGQEMHRQALPVTFSIGAITFGRPSSDVDLMIRRIDALMYQAKVRGKGRIEHTVAWDMSPAADEPQPLERRATARVLCNRVARVRPEGQETIDEYATVRDISAVGVGLHVEKEFAMDTQVIVEPLCAGVKALLVRVRRVTREGGGFLHGCELSVRLSDEELQRWVGGLAEAAAALSAEARG
jgi:diguanylate cyclase (GGDEF)-like protein